MASARTLEAAFALNLLPGQSVRQTDRDCHWLSMAVALYHPLLPEVSLGQRQPRSESLEGHERNDNTEREQYRQHIKRTDEMEIDYLLEL